jgi:hypothetical protein
VDTWKKIHVIHLSRFVFFFNPHDKKPWNLSKLSDPSTWEKRRLKAGKHAVKKMVVNQMELSLQRLRQRRPPYPKPVAGLLRSLLVPFTLYSASKLLIRTAVRYLLGCYGL